MRVESVWPSTEEPFRDYLLTHGRATRTADSYTRTARRYVAWCELRQACPFAAPSNLVSAYLAALKRRLEDGQSRPTNTLPLTLSHLRAFFEFCRHAELRQDDPTLGMKMKWLELLPRRPLNRDELAALFGACRNERDRVMIQLAYDCGLRVAEVVGVKEEDIDFESGIIRIHGKGSRDRPVVPSPQTLKALTPFQGRTGGILWWTWDGRPLNVKRAQNNMDNISVRAGVRAHWHVLRTTFANHTLSQGVRLEVLRKMMGHAHISTTEHYAGWTINETVMEQMRALHLVEHYLT